MLTRFAAGTLLLSGACSPTPTEPGADDPGRSSDTSVLPVTFTTEGLRSAAGLSISRLDVRIAEIVFDADGPRNSISVTRPVDALVDVAKGTSEPDVVGLELPPGCYGSPYLGVELAYDGAEPALILEGALDGVPVRFVFDSGEVFEAEAESVQVETGTTRAVEFRLQPERWFADVDASRLVLGGDGVAEISERSNAGIFDEVADALDETTDGRFPSVSACKKEDWSTRDSGTARASHGARSGIARACRRGASGTW